MGERDARDGSALVLMLSTDLATISAATADASGRWGRSRVVCPTYDLDVASALPQDVAFPSDYVAAADVESIYERSLQLQRSMVSSPSASAATVDDFFEPGVGFGWWALSQCFPAIHLRLRFAETLFRVLEREQPAEIFVVSDPSTPRWQRRLLLDVVAVHGGGARLVEHMPAGLEEGPSLDVSDASPAPTRERATSSPREDLRRFLDEQADARQSAADGHLVLVMRGTGRAARFGGRKSRLLTDEYSEGVVDAILTRCQERKWRVTVIYEGKAPPRERRRSWQRGPLVVEVGTFDLRDRLRRPAAWQPVDPARVEAFLLEPGFRDRVSHRGVDLMPALAPELARRIVRLADQAARLKGWATIFEDLDPDVVLGGRLEANPFLVGAATRKGARTLSVKLGLGNEMLPATLAYDPLGSFDSANSPDVLLVWGEESAQLLREKVDGFAAEVVVSGRTRNDSFVKGRVSRGATGSLKKSLGIPRSGRIIVYGATSYTQYGREPEGPSGACVMSPEMYRQCLETLVEVAEESEDAWVVVKPHPADREDLISAWTQELGGSRTVFLAARSSTHNVDLLRAASLFVSSPTSMFGEAVLCDVPSINICTPDVTYFYEPRKCELFGRIAVNVATSEELGRLARDLLGSRERVLRELARARTGFTPIFGPADGGNALRTADAALARSKTSVS